VQRYAANSDQVGPSQLERCSFWIGFGMAGLGLAASGLLRWVSPVAVLYITGICLVAELAGIGLSLGLMLRRTLPKLMRFRQVHAVEIDADFDKWQELIAELRRFPHSEREQRLRFVAALSSRMDQRLGLAYGSVQRLGIFPVLLALYLQLRNWKWGDWTGAFDVNLLAGLLIWAMVLLYAGGWLLIGLRTRLETYVDLLENSLRYDSQEAVEKFNGK